MSSVQQPLYGVVGQPLTQDYLAKQLPIFQQKVPHFQPKPQFPTNSPANLPLPPLYPGEVIQLQEHRVVCTDAFEEPAVGAIYVSNYRIIFHGNLISDPESLDAIQDTNLRASHKLDTAPSPIPFAKSAGKYKPFSSTRPEPSFKSFLVGGNTGPPPESMSPNLQYGSLPRSHAQRFKSGFRKISSLRLTSRNRPKLGRKSTEYIDGPIAEGGSFVEEKQVPDKAKRKDIILNYRQDTVSLDSVSVSSTSEFSTAGTDDRSTCSPCGDGERGERGGFSGPVDIVNGGEQVCLISGDKERTLGFSDPLLSSSIESPLEVCATSYQTVDSGITVDSEVSPTDMTAGKGLSTVTDGKGSLLTSGVVGKGSSSQQPQERVRGNEAQVSQLSTLDTSTADVSDQDAKLSQIDSSWSSTSEDSTCRLTVNSRSGTLKANTSGDSDTLKTGTTPTSNGDFGDSGVQPEANCGEAAVADGNRGAEQAGRGYANLCIMANSTRTDHKAVSRKRSKSSTSPHTRKKPKPLPRKSLVKQLLCEDARNELFLSSLPSNFKPTPLPRSTPPTSTPGTPPTTTPRQTPPTTPPTTTPRRTPPTTPPTSTPATPPTTTPRRTPPTTPPTSTRHTRTPAQRPTSPKQDSLDSPRMTGSCTPQQKSSSPCTSQSKSPGLSVPNQKPDSTTPNPIPGQSPSGPSSKSSDSPDLGSPSVFRRKDLPPLKTSQVQADLAGSKDPGTLSASDPSTPNSPLYGSSNSNVSSDVERPDGALTSADPVPPPRRRRRSKYKSRESSKDSINVLPVSPEEVVGGDELDGRVLGGSKQPSRDGPGDSGSSKSHDLESHDLDDSASSKSRDPHEEDILNSPLAEERSDLFRQNGISPPSFVGRDSQYSISSSIRTSRTSLTVFADSGSNTTMPGTISRPYSLISPGDCSRHFNFAGLCDQSSDPFSGGHTMPRSVGGATWSPRQQVAGNRNSVKVASTRYSLCVSFPLRSIHSIRKIASVSLKEQGLKLPEGILVLCRTFQSMRLHIHSQNTYDADALKEILERKFLGEKPLYERFAFQYRMAIRHPNPTFLQNRGLPNYFHLSAEMTRLGLPDCKQWTVSRVLTNHPDLCPSYPSHLIVPTCTGDLDYIRAAKQYREGRFPTLSWYHHYTGTALFRAACTCDERGQSSMQMDEALLQSISGSKLDPKGPNLIVHIYTDKPDSSLSERNAEQVRTYNYHNCVFKYAPNLSEYRTVRHSFNKLQAMLENAVSDEDYLIGLDTTRWLPRVAEILSTACSICRSLLDEGAHALVCYETGWDKTTQLVSLAQLLMDPYYRTMDGFQVLVQKEWVWFGHPFQLRHSRSGKSKDDSPIFLQWTDCVWQVMLQCPSAFEFNEKFLMVMVEHSYSGLFGTFITNNENARKQYFTEKNYEHKSVSSHTISFWTWVGMVNAAGSTFYNDLYDPDTYKGVIKPNSSISNLRLWTNHYCRCKPQENVYQSSVLQTQLEELLKTKKKLEALYNELAPPSTYEDASLSFPPALGPRDELMMVPTSDSGVHGDKPIPPPKPAYKYESLTEFLVKEGFDPSICKHLELGAAICQGSLLKLGAIRKNWLQRWFVLDFNCKYLAYFENQLAYSNKDPPKGVIRLGDISKVFQDVKKKDHLMKNIFMLETPNRVYQVQAPTIMSMYVWMACLELPVSSLKLGTQ